MKRLTVLTSWRKLLIYKELVTRGVDRSKNWGVQLTESSQRTAVGMKGEIVGHSSKSTDDHFGISAGTRQASCLLATVNPSDPRQPRKSCLIKDAVDMTLSAASFRDTFRIPLLCQSKSHQS